MNLLVVRVERDIHWKLDGLSAEVFPLEFPNISGIVNPLTVYQNARNWAGLPKEDSEVRGVVSVDGESFLSFNFLVCISDLTPSQENIERIVKQTYWLLKALRYVSGQVSIPLAANMYTGRELSTIPAPISPDSLSKSQGMMYGAPFSAPVSLASLQELANLEYGSEFPIYQLMMLDAIEAHTQGDFRRSILYSAIAVETMAEIVLAERYDDLKLSHLNDERFRLKEIVVGKNSLSRIDPVYEQLSEGLPNFRKLLHVKPLYLMSRSLLYEDKALFDRAGKLYNTRNKIAHTGLGASSDAGFGLEKTDSATCIEIAMGVFKWFSVAKEYRIPSESFVMCEFLRGQEGDPDRA